jgi:hypothetical protein
MPLAVLMLILAFFAAGTIFSHYQDILKRLLSLLRVCRGVSEAFERHGVDESVQVCLY